VVDAYVVVIVPAPPHASTRRTPKGPFASRESAIPEEKGRLSNPVQRRLSAAQVDELVERYRQGASIGALGRHFLVHRITIINHLDRRGIPRRRTVRKMTDSAVARAAERYAAGLSVAEVAGEFGVHARTLARELRRLEMAIRGRRGNMCNVGGTVGQLGDLWNWIRKREADVDP
jgi:AraC-like DNA-binding protein